MPKIILPFLLLLLATLSPTLSAQPRRDPFLDMVQQRSFLYFWELTNPDNGLTPDRAPSPSFCSIAAVGFALSSYIVGVERQFITRTAAANRVLTTLKFFWHAPQGTDPHHCTGHRGFFYHFLEMTSGLRWQTVELSSIDTTLLLAGVLSCQSYFDRDTAIENEIRDYADRLYRRTDWRWLQARPPLIGMGWQPESGLLPNDWQGYNEAMILYILALGSPTYPIGPEAWPAWTKTYVWGDWYGYPQVNFSPLFGHQYSHIWIDFRGLQDSYMRDKNSDYFQNSRAATYANRAYCLANPGQWHGYAETIWGLTASDGPGDREIMINGKIRIFHGYWARGASLLETCDDGTIAPTAVGGSLPFAPEICIPALHAMYDQYGQRVFGQYGFYDAFNLTWPGDPQYPDKDTGWFDPDYLGIDNGPIVLMIENHYTGLLWEIMKKNRYVVTGLQQAGFSGGWLK